MAIEVALKVVLPVIEVATPSIVEAAVPKVVEAATPKLIEAAAPKIIQAAPKIMEAATCIKLAEPATPKLIEAISPSLVETASSSALQGVGAAVPFIGVGYDAVNAGRRILKDPSDPNQYLLACGDLAVGAAGLLPGVGGLASLVGTAMMIGADIAIDSANRKKGQKKKQRRHSKLKAKRGHQKRKM